MPDAASAGHTTSRPTGLSCGGGGLDHMRSTGRSKRADEARPGRLDGHVERPRRQRDGGEPRLGDVDSAIDGGDSAAGSDANPSARRAMAVELRSEERAQHRDRRGRRAVAAGDVAERGELSEEHVRRGR